MGLLGLVRGMCSTGCHSELKIKLILFYSTEFILIGLFFVWLTIDGLFLVLFLVFVVSVLLNESLWVGCLYGKCYIYKVELSQNKLSCNV